MSLCLNIVNGMTKHFLSSPAEDSTIAYYDANVDRAYSVFSQHNTQELCDVFLSYLPKNAHILDLGCGMGRDTKYFLGKGYQVTAIDASEELVKRAREYTQHLIHVMRFEDVNFPSSFDGIWAMASLLHINKAKLPNILRQNIIPVLKKDGILFMSFCYGKEEGIINGRFFNNYNVKSLTKVLEELDNIEIIHIWRNRSRLAQLLSWIRRRVIPSQLRKQPGIQVWLHCIVRRK